MSETIIIGKKYRVFLINKFKFEGKALAIDDKFLKIYDNQKAKPILLPLTSIDNIEEIEDTTTEKNRGVQE